MVIDSASRGTSTDNPSKPRSTCLMRKGVQEACRDWYDACGKAERVQKQVVSDLLWRRGVSTPGHVVIASMTNLNRRDGDADHKRLCFPAITSRMTAI